MLRCLNELPVSVIFLIVCFFTDPYIFLFSINFHEMFFSLECSCSVNEWWLTYLKCYARAGAESMVVVYNHC